MDDTHFVKSGCQLYVFDSSNDVDPFDDLADPATGPLPYEIAGSEIGDESTRWLAALPDDLVEQLTSQGYALRPATVGERVRIDVSSPHGNLVASEGVAEVLGSTTYRVFDFDDDSDTTEG